jgi:hypothetical protein
MWVVGGLMDAVRKFFGWQNLGRRRRGDATFSATNAGCYEELLSECGRLRERARRAGVELDDSPRSLDDLDRLLALWRANPGSASWLPIEAGSYLGTVMTRSLPGARWQIGLDGHPVVRLHSGRVFDVLSASGGQAGVPTLASSYAQARVS